MTDVTYFERNVAETLNRLEKGFPVIGITGPRQSGKTTLARHHFSEKPYASLENPDHLDFAQTDPRGFLAQFPQGAVLDEVQRCPILFSYIQGLVDESRTMGLFVLTGSQQFDFRARISQTLAGRIALIQLLPFSISEIKKHTSTLPALNSLMYQGFYPPIYDRNVLPSDWYAAYVQTYVERDLQQIIQVKDIARFRNFLRLCAGRCGQIVNFSSLGNDCGVSHNTIKEWLSVLEASYIIFRLPPHFRNFSKRLIKSPKLYFYDTGLLCWLLGIREHNQVAVNPLRGSIFENLIVSELIKERYAKGETSNLYFWRDRSGLEIDVIIDTAQALLPVEIKAGQTITQDYFSSLSKWASLAQVHQSFVVYGGNESQVRSQVSILSWQDLDQLIG